MSGKPTKAQKLLLEAMSRGETLRREFDVWAGYWWELDGTPINPRPPTALLDAKAIALSDAVSRFSGRQTCLARMVVSSGRNRADAKIKKSPHQKDT